MVTRLKGSRLLRLLLVVFMVPLIVMASTNSAEAAGTWVKTRHEVNFDALKGVSAYGTVRCDVESIREEEGAGDIQVRGLCRGPADLSPGFAQPGEQGAGYRVRYIGDGCDGVFAQGILQANSADGLFRVAGQFGPHPMGAGGCEPQEVCIALTDEGGTAGGDFPWRESCTALTLPTIVVDCEYGTVYKPEIGERYGAIDHGLGWWSKTFRDVTVQHDLQDPGAGYDWWMYVATRTLEGDTDVTEGPIMDRLADPAVRLNGWSSGAEFGNANTVVRVPITGDWDHDKVSDGPDIRKIVGVGLYREKSPGHDEWKTPRNYQPGDVGRVGRHDLPNCSFYWGEPLWTDGEPGGIDTPAGSLEPPVDPPPEDDHSDEHDESNWWRGLLDGLWQLLDAVKALPGRIANAIAGFFIPSDGYVSSKLDGLADQMGDSGPGQYVSAVGDLIPTGGASGCAGPALDFEFGDQAQTFKPLDACSGPRATMATASTALVSVGVVLFGGLACVRAIGSGFGWNPGVGDS